MFLLNNLNLSGLGFGGAMAIIDALVLSSLKAYNLGWFQWRGVVVFAMLIYSMQPVLFLESLQLNSLTVMNLLWDILSDVLVTSIGLFYFSEKLSNIKKLGVFFSFISIILLSWKDGD